MSLSRRLVSLRRIVIIWRHRVLRGSKYLVDQCFWHSSPRSNNTASSMTVCLPFEILTAIFEEVDDVRDLWHVRTASRTLCAAATPSAFRVLSVISTRGSAQNLGRLFDVPDIAAHVREVTYHDTGADRRGRTQKYGASSPPSSHKRYHDLSLGGGGSHQSELAPSTNWPVRFLAFTSCPGSRASI